VNKYKDVLGLVSRADGDGAVVMGMGVVIDRASSGRLTRFRRSDGPPRVDPWRQSESRAAALDPLLSASPRLNHPPGPALRRPPRAPHEPPPRLCLPALLCCSCSCCCCYRCPLRWCYRETSGQGLPRSPGWPTA